MFKEKFSERTNSKKMSEKIISVQKSLKFHRNFGQLTFFKIKEGIEIFRGIKAPKYTTECQNILLSAIEYQNIPLYIIKH
jgi:hypothetical protein